MKQNNTTYQILAIILVTIFLATPGWAQDGQSIEESLKQATELRNQSGELFNTGQFVAGAKVLREADAIYERLGPKHFGERFVTLRALIFHEAGAGQVDNALGSIRKLSSLVSRQEDKMGQLEWAFRTAIANTLTKDLRFEKSADVLAKCRKIFKSYKFAQLEADSWNYEGNLSGRHKRWADMETSFRKAIALNEKLRNEQQVAWVYNNLASYLIDAGLLGRAMAALEESTAFFGQGLLEHEAAVALNFGSLVDKLSKSEKVSRRQTNWLWLYAEKRASSGEAIMIPADYMLRTAALFEAKNPRSVKSAVRRLSRATVVGAPLEVRIDMQLRAAKLASDGGQGKLALSILKKLQIQDGLCQPLMTARLSLGRSLAFIDLKDDKKLPNELKRTRSLFEGLKSRGLEEDALKSLAAAFLQWPESSLGKDVNQALARMRRNRAPGGNGASATSRGASDAIAKLTPHDAVFRIYGNEDGKIVMKDVLSGSKRLIQSRWKPSKIGINGVSLEFFGGYLRVVEVNYGRATKATGSPGVMTLDGFKNYWPIPQNGGVEITKNGAVRFFQN